VVTSNKVYIFTLQLKIKVMTKSEINQFLILAMIAGYFIVRTISTFIL